MRDRLAKVTATCLITLMVGLAGFFAYRLNPPEDVVAVPPSQPSEAAPPPSALDADLVARGGAIYEELACSRCHSVAGRGNPRSSLDTVGSRRSRSEIRAWLTAEQSVRDRLSRSVVRAKEGFAELPADELDALVEYLSSLR